MLKILYCEVDQIAEGMEHDMKFQIYNGFVLWEQRDMQQSAVTAGGLRSIY